MTRDDIIYVWNVEEPDEEDIEFFKVNGSNYFKQEEYINKKYGENKRKEKNK